MQNHYLDIAAEVQALRRHVDGCKSASSFALGVRAHLYPHQVGNVEHLLGGPKLRHLLADEVGLGKTVQALMVINSVRRDHPDAKIAVLVPDTLMSQWRDELLARGHEAPSQGEEDLADRGRNVHLLWPGNLERTAEVDPEYYSLIIVDELHNLTVDLRDHLSRIAAEIPGLLLLSATPALHSPSSRLELLTLLEPYIVREAARAYQESIGRSLDKILRRWPLEDQVGVLSLLDAGEDSMLDEVASLPREKQEQAALQACLHRRILRSNRREFSRLLPHRQHVPTPIEPSEAEEAREVALMAYLRHPKVPRGLDRELLAKRAVLGGPSLTSRVTGLVRDNLDLDDHLATIRTLSGEGAGDTRLDALSELLCGLWLENPSEKVVVACLDNPTVDFIHRKIGARLSRVGPWGAGCELLIEVARRGEGQASELVGSDSLAQEAIGRFKDGPAQLLIAGDIAEVGLNLQCARKLIFYALPWRLDEVEQWVGRLDRLGHEVTDEGGAISRPLEVHTLSMDGLMDSRVVEAIAATGVFHTPVDPTSDAAGALDRELGLAILDGSPLPPAPDLNESGEPETSLSSLLPFCPERATEAFWRNLHFAPSEPALVSPDSAERSIEHHQRELALEGWLELLCAAEHYKVRYFKKKGHSTFWYRYSDAGLGKRRALTTAILPRIKDPDNGPSPVNAVAFLSRRKQVLQPPRPEVPFQLPWDDQIVEMLPLQFLNHGGLLHDDLVSTWLDRGQRRGPTTLRLQKGSEHPFSEEPGIGLYLVSIGWLDPGEHLLPIDELALTRRQTWALAADRRWLRSQLSAETLCFAERVPMAPNRDNFEQLEEGVGWNLLKPLLHPLGPDVRKTWSPPYCDQAIALDSSVPNIVKHLGRANEYFSGELRRRWSSGLDELQCAADNRSAVILHDDKYEAIDLESQEDEVRSRAEGLGELAARIPLGRADNLRTELQALEAESVDRQCWLADACMKAIAPQASLFNTFLIKVEH